MCGALYTMHHELLLDRCAHQQQYTISKAPLFGKYYDRVTQQLYTVGHATEAELYKSVCQ
jgi:hypothetical protein